MPWKKGQSGNPSGARKRIPHWVAEFRRMEPQAFKAILSILGDESAKDSDRLHAVELALAYSRGRPKQQVEMSGPDGGPIGVDLDAKAVLADPDVRSALQRAALAAYGAARVPGDPGDAGSETR